MISFILFFFLLVASIISAILSASETAYFSLDEVTLSQFSKSSKKSRQFVSRLLKDPKGLLVTLLMINISMNIVVQNITASIFEEEGGIFYSIILPLLITLIIGEIIPKTVALTMNTFVAETTSVCLYKVHLFFAPIRILITKIASYISHSFFFFIKNDKNISSVELAHLLHSKEAQHSLTSQEVQFLSGFLKLEEQSIKEVMRPKKDIISWSLSEEPLKLYELFTSSSVSKIAVFNEQHSVLLGVIHIEDFMLFTTQEVTVANICKVLKKPHFVPETLSGKVCLDSLVNENKKIAFVVDEYGDIEGLVSKEDLLELAMGNEPSEFRSVDFELDGSNALICDASIEVEKVDAILETCMSLYSTSSTMNGFLMEKLEAIPKAGDVILDGHIEITVLKASKKCALRIYIRRFVYE